MILNMKKMCSWCNQEIDSGMTAGPDQEITHGICEACAVDILGDIEVMDYSVSGGESQETLKTPDF